MTAEEIECAYEIKLDYENYPDDLSALNLVKLVKSVQVSSAQLPKFVAENPLCIYKLYEAASEAPSKNDHIAALTDQLSAMRVENTVSDGKLEK